MKNKEILQLQEHGRHGQNRIDPPSVPIISAALSQRVCSRCPSLSPERFLSRVRGLPEQTEHQAVFHGQDGHYQYSGNLRKDVRVEPMSQCEPCSPRQQRVENTTAAQLTCLRIAAFAANATRFLCGRG